MGGIIYHCLIQGKHMTDVRRDRVCLIYTLMCDDIEINVGVVIFFVMKKVCYHEGRQYRFCGLLTRFLRRHNVEEKG